MITLDPAVLHTVAFLDPGSSRRGAQLKATTSRSALIVVSGDDIGRCFIRYAWAGRSPVDVLVDQVMLVHRRFAPRIFGIESSAQQSLFVGGLNFISRLMDEKVRLAPIDQPTKVTKEFRIRAAIRPKIATGALFCPDTPEFLELRAEMDEFPSGATMDMVDALASAITLLPPPIPQQVRDDVLEGRLRWLREQGVDPRTIERVARGEEIEDTQPVLR